MAWSLWRYVLPLGRGTRAGLILRLRHAGAEGLGEAAPLAGVHAGDVDAVARELRAFLGRGPDLIGVDQIFGSREGALSPTAATAWEQACWALQADRGSVGPRHLVAPAAPGRVASNALVAGVHAPEHVERARALGHSCVKLKVGRRAAALELETLRQVRERMGPQGSIRLDANRAWTLAEARAFLARAAPQGIAYIEEPVRDPRDLPALAAFLDDLAQPVPLALDESLRAPGWQAWLPHVAALIIKPSAVGGMGATARLVRAALEAGKTPVLTSCFEAAPGRQGIAELAAALVPGDTPMGLGTGSWFVQDLADLADSGPWLVLRPSLHYSDLRAEALTLIGEGA